MRIQVDYDSVCVHSERGKGSYADWHKAYDCSVTDVFRIGDDTKVPYDSESFIIPDDSETVYVVYMLYSEGDSFGNSTGNIDIIHATVSEESAHQLAQKIRDDEQSYTIKFVDDFGREISISNNGAGYFNRLECVNVERFDIRKGKKKTSYR